MRTATLERLLRPAGYFRLKTQRLKNLCRWIVAEGGVRRLARRSTGRLRGELLSVDGIGPETADAILLYAFGRAVFVVDAYAQRLLGRLGLIEPGMRYESLRERVEVALDHSREDLNEFHALIVAHGKRHCRKRPRCADCALKARCQHFARAPSAA